MEEINTEATRKGPKKRAQENTEPERPPKRHNVAPDVSPTNWSSSETESPGHLTQRANQSRTSTSSSSSSSSSLILPSLHSSHALSIDQLLQTVQDSNHAPGFFARCTSSESISDVDSENTQSRKSPTPGKATDCLGFDLQHHFDRFPSCSCFGSHMTFTDKLPGIHHLDSVALHSQPQHLPVANYMTRQLDLNEHMRGILFDWLVEVAEEYKLKSATLHLTISVIDRFLSECILTRDQLQLVGVSSMLIASKIEELFPPRVGDFVFISDNAYNKAEISKMEKKIHSVLGSTLRTPTIHTFLELFQTTGHLDEEVCQLSNYLGELVLMEYSFIRHEPRKIAASVIAIALHSTECITWSDALQSTSHFTLHQLRDCMSDVLSLFLDAPTSQLQAVREKYSAPNPYLCVSNIAPPDTLPNV
eukprot:c4020_g1_i1.p1 GENE.c4020_g1_i1~~c4020_g1_i1.p1  ORF type:complete len:419 (-),score=56.97 c4020_g1_i1:270-1526(-)